MGYNNFTELKEEGLNPEIYKEDHSEDLNETYLVQPEDLPKFRNKYRVSSLSPSGYYFMQYSPYSNEYTIWTPEQELTSLEQQQHSISKKIETIEYLINDEAYGTETN